MKPDRFRLIWPVFPALFLMLFAAAGAAAHGTGFRLVETRDARAVRCYYASGDPMAYAKVLVYGPEDRDTEHQNGRTDRAGSFAFLPDRPGKWRVIVNDGQGHRLEAKVPVAPSPVPDGAKVPGSGYEGDTGREGSTLKIVGALCGVSLIFNFFFLVYSRRRDTAEHSE